MKALVYERNIIRYAATKALGKLVSPKVTMSPLRLLELDPPNLPDANWVDFIPKLSGICGSDLATVSSTSSRFLEDFVSFPFTMGHEVVGEYTDDSGKQRRAVLIPTLNCEIRGNVPKCAQCEVGQTQRCQMLHLGTLATGLQTGFCKDTSGGWSQALVAHKAQLFDINDSLDDESAVLLEPFACAIHAALSIGPQLDAVIAVVGSGTLGILTIAALRSLYPGAEIVATARYDHQKKLAKTFGASSVCSESELYRYARMMRNAHMAASDKPTDGFGIVFDAVGSSTSIGQALKVSAPGATVVLAGMPNESRLDLTPLWMKEISLKGSYAYGIENLGGKKISTFQLAASYAEKLDLAQLLSATYRLEDYEMAIEHATNAGKRGSIKIAFDMRKAHNRGNWSQYR